MPWPPPITVIGVSWTPSSSAAGTSSSISSIEIACGGVSSRTWTAIRRSPAATPVGHRDGGGDRLRRVREQRQVLGLQGHPGRVGAEHPQVVAADQRAGVVHGDQHLDGVRRVRAHRSHRAAQAAQSGRTDGRAELDPVRRDEHPHRQPPAPGTLPDRRAGRSRRVACPPAVTVTSEVRLKVVGATGGHRVRHRPGAAAITYVPAAAPGEGRRRRHRPAPLAVRGGDGRARDRHAGGVGHHAGRSGPASRSS